MAGCFDVEEQTTFKTADSGDFTLSVDMGKLFAQLKMFGGAEQLEGLDAKDSLVYFKDVLEKDTVLTAAEKNALNGGFIRMHFNAGDDEMKAEFSAPFKTVSDLGIIRTALFKVIANTGKTSLPGMQNDASGGPNLSIIDVNSYGFSFTARRGNIANVITDSAGLREKVDNDFMMQQVKMIAPLMGIASPYKRVFNFTAPIKGFKAENSTLSTDKKTLTITNDFFDLFENPKSFEYSVSY